MSISCILMISESWSSAVAVLFWVCSWDRPCWGSLNLRSFEWADLWKGAVLAPKQSPRAAEENCMTICLSRKTGEEIAPASCCCSVSQVAGPKPSDSYNLSYKLFAKLLGKTWEFLNSAFHYHGSTQKRNVWFSFAVKTELTAHMDCTTCNLGRAPGQSLQLYSAAFSVITWISIYLPLSLLSLWSNSAPSLVFPSFQHVQKWLRQQTVWCSSSWACHRHYNLWLLVPVLLIASHSSAVNVSSSASVQAPEAWLDCTIHFTVGFFFFFSCKSIPQWIC